MTCKEKLIADHPDWTKEEVECHVHNYCPSDYGYLDDPPRCWTYKIECKDCWNRGIPENIENETKKEHTEMSYSSDALIDSLKKELEDCKVARDRAIAQLESDKEELEMLLLTRVDNSNQIKRLNDINEDLANRLEAERANNKELKDKVKLRDEELAKLVMENQDLVDTVKAKEKWISELGTIAERFDNCNNSCALSPNDICHAIARSMYNKYSALVDAGFSHDDAMSLIPMWTD